MKKKKNILAALFAAIVFTLAGCSTDDDLVEQGGIIIGSGAVSGQDYTYNDTTNTFTVYSGVGLATAAYAINTGTLAGSQANNTYAKANIILGRDINMSGITYEPIGTQDKPYTGTFDGAGFTISNLKIDFLRYLQFSSLCAYVGEGGTVKNLTMATPDIYGDIAVGGIAASNKGTIENCKVSGGKIYSHCFGGHCGGIVGINGDNNGGSNVGVIIRCTVEGDATISNTMENGISGGIVGSTISGTVGGSLENANRVTKGTNFSLGTVGIMGDIAAEYYNSNVSYNYVDSDFCVNGNEKLFTVSTNGDGELVFGVNSAKGLDAISEMVNSGMKNDINVDITGHIQFDAKKPFTPIGTADYPYNGTFNSTNNIRFYNLTVSADSAAGLFGVIGKEGVVSSVHFRNVSITGGTNVGIIAGINYGEIYFCTIDNGSVTANGASDSYAGGVVGVNFNLINEGGIRNTTTICNAVHCGGIAGCNSVDTIQDVKGHIKGTFVVGDTTIGSENCQYAGGIVGSIVDGIIGYDVVNKVSTIGGLEIVGKTTGIIYGGKYGGKVMRNVVDDNVIYRDNGE